MTYKRFYLHSVDQKKSCGLNKHCSSFEMKGAENLVMIEIDFISPNDLILWWTIQATIVWVTLKEEVFAENSAATNISHIKLYWRLVFTLTKGETIFPFLNTITMLSFTGMLYFRKCRWRQKSCQRSFAAETWAQKGWSALGWDHYSLDSPKRNPPHQACHLANFGTQWPSLSHLSLSLSGWSFLF